MSNREEFEQLEDIKDILNDHKIFFNEKEDRYQAEIITGNDSVYYPSWEITYMNGAWYSWQAAKAQAVPEGFVLVLKEPTEKMIDAGHDFCKNNIVTPSVFYKAMIEAQEQGHE